MIVSKRSMQLPRTFHSTRHEQEKKREYDQRVREIERSTLLPWPQLDTPLNVLLLSVTKPNKSNHNSIIIIYTVYITVMGVLIWRFTEDSTKFIFSGGHNVIAV